MMKNDDYDVAAAAAVCMKVQGARRHQRQCVTRVQDYVRALQGVRQEDHQHERA
jgi:hypothetical protein